MNALRRFLLDERGPTAVEYAVMLAMVIVLCIGAVITLGDSSAKLWSDNDKGLQGAFKGE